MADMTKFGCFFRKDYYNAGFREFNKEYFNNERNKFIQLYINNEPLIFTGDGFYHKDILKLSLQKLELKYDIKPNRDSEVPLFEGKNYKMVGAGKIILVKEDILFHDNSSEYIANLNGANQKHLEDFFGADKVKEGEKMFKVPLFLVRI